MSTNKDVYLNHIRRLLNEIKRVKRVASSFYEDYQEKDRIIKELESDLEHKELTLTHIKGGWSEISKIRRGREFFLKVGRIEIEVITCGGEGVYGLDFNILGLGYNDYSEIKKELNIFIEEIELFYACPSNAYELNNCDFSSREFKKVLRWWALYEEEKEHLEHLYKLKYNYKYRQEHAEKERLNEEKERAKTKRKRNHNTYIYIMKDEQTGFHKIGYSKNPKVRESTLFSEKPSINLINTWKGCLSDETELHQCFDDKRIRGEWFDLEPEQLLLTQQVFAHREEFENA